MNLLRFAGLYALVVLAGCGGAPNTSAPPSPTSSNSPPISGTESVTASNSTTVVLLPNTIGGIYGGDIVLPPGSGTATLTFSLSHPTSVTALTELTPQPQVAYLALTAQTTFTLAAMPGLNLAVPPAYMGIDMWLNYYDGTAWSSDELGWPSGSVGVMCFAPRGASVSLQTGQSLFLGINGDNVLPTPIATVTPPPCPQPAG